MYKHPKRPRKSPGQECDEQAKRGQNRNERAPHHGSKSVLLNGISTPGGYGTTSNPKPRLLPSSTRSASNAMTRSTVSTTLVKPPGCTSIRMNGSPAGPSTNNVALDGHSRWPFTMAPVWGIWSIAASITGIHARLMNQTAVPATAKNEEALNTEQSPATGYREPGHAAYRKRLPCLSGSVIRHRPTNLLSPYGL